MVIDLPTIRLREHESTTLLRDLLSNQEAQEIAARFGTVIEVEWPSGGNGERWRLRPGGTIGVVVLRSGRRIEIDSKVPIANLFRMLELAWNLEIREEDGEVAIASIDDLYRRLAVMLARRVERRRRIGLHRDYISRTDRLSVVRGRLDLATTLASPWRVDPLCHYQEQTSDVMENRILSWTLEKILRMGIFAELQDGNGVNQRREVMNAFRGIRDSSPPREVSAMECVDRHYTRLTEDYRSMHALCRFFLELTGPSSGSGEHESFPFLLSMDRLFELYVGAWLTKHRPGGLYYSMHERRPIGTGLNKSIDVDIVARREPGGPIVAVLDTKYKRHNLPKNADMYQVASYAAYFGAPDAWLIYPTTVDNFDVAWGTSSIRVRTHGVNLEDMTSLEQGTEFIGIEP